MRRRPSVLAIGGAALAGLLTAPASAQPQTRRAKLAIEILEQEVPPVELFLVVPEVAAEASRAFDR